MVKVDIYVKEATKRQLVVSVEPHMEGCTELEITAAFVLNKHINAALEEFQLNCKEHQVDIEGDTAVEWRKKIFGD